MISTLFFKIRGCERHFIFVFHRPGRYFAENLAEAGIRRYFTGLAGTLLKIWQKPVFFKSVPETVFLINNLHFAATAKRTNAELIKL